MIHFYAGSLDHHTNHLAPIYQSLPSSIRGQFVCRNQAASRASSLGIPPTRTRNFRQGETVVVCSYADYKFTSPADVIFLCHGAGQRYDGDERTRHNESFTGGRNRDRVVMFLCPSQRVADLWQRVHPNTPAIPVGPCYLDQFIPHTVPADGPVAISFHLNQRLIPEMQWAWPHYRFEIERLVQAGKHEFIGHSHPRARRQLEPWWKKLGVRYEPDWWKVLQQASVYIVDTSSTLWESAALGIPTIALNIPDYRRTVHHDLRFWSAIPGVEVDDPSHLPASIQLARTDDPTLQLKRQHAVHYVYDNLVDGRATTRAVDAIVSANGPVSASNEAP